MCVWMCVCIHRPKYKYGMNEVAIGMTVPPVGVELARHRM